MNSPISCFTDCDDNRLPADNLDRARAVEEYADDLMRYCFQMEGACDINKSNDLYDGDLLPSLMVEIALWNGSQYHGEHNAAVQMRKLYNMLANALQTIAEKEVK